MIRAIFWKEWREHHWKYLAYWLVLNSPILAVTLAIALSAGARAPFSDLSDSTALKYLAIGVVGESALIPTIFLFVTGFLAVATFSAEIEDGSLFFMYEQPLSRERYVAIKLLNGAFHIVMACTCAVILAPAVAFVLMLISGKVTIAGSAGILATTFAACLRGAVWCSLVSLVGFTGSVLISALLPRWWLAIAGSLLFIVLFGVVGGDFFEFAEPVFEKAESMSVGISFGTAQWLTVTGVLPLHSFAQWRALPLLAALLLVTAFSVATAFVYRRKELK